MSRVETLILGRDALFASRLHALFFFFLLVIAWRVLGLST